MRFVKANDLKPGMRIGRPIYNKKGVLLFDRDSKLTDATISSINNFGLLGIFVLDAAEPLPPMTDEEREFERFLTINVYALETELKDIISSKRVKRLEYIINDVVSHYGRTHMKIDLMEDIRSREDFVYKHSLKTSILMAMMTLRMNVPVAERSECMIAALVHDIGKITVNESLVQKASEDELELLYSRAEEEGFGIIENVFSTTPGVKRICAQSYRSIMNLKYHREQEIPKLVLGARLLNVCKEYDRMTSIDVIHGNEPKSSVEALKYLYEHPDAFHPKAVEALTDSIKILDAGMSVILSNGSKALVMAPNYGNILRPVVLDFATNEIMDLSNKRLFDDLEIVDIVKVMDERYAMDLAKLDIGEMNKKITLERKPK